MRDEPGGAHERVRWALGSTDDDQLAGRYEAWAGTYDDDLGDTFGWIAPQVAVEIFRRHVPSGARVLDAGAGTGLVGERLAAAGSRRIGGIVLSEAMLAEASAKRVYSEVHRMALGEPLDFEDGAFGAVVSCGVLTPGHAPARSLRELVRVTRRGGHVVWSMRVDHHEAGGFADVVAELEAAGRWRLAEVTDPAPFLPKGEPDVLHQMWAMEVTA